MKKLKTVLFPLLAALTLAFTACESSENEVPAASSQTSSQSSSAQSSNDPEPSESSDSSTISQSSETSSISSISSTSSTSSAQSASESQIAETSSESGPETSEPEAAAMLKAPDGKAPDLTNAAALDPSGEQISLDEIRPDAPWSIRIPDIAYLASPKGVFFDNINNTFDSEEYSFPDSPNNIAHEFKAYKKGESFGGLTITKAFTTFSSMTDFCDNYFGGCYAILDGEAVVTGKIALAAEDGMYTTKRDIFFAPSGDCKELPVMNFRGRMSTQMYGEYVLQSEFGIPISLGNADGYPDIDFSRVPTDGTFVNAKIKITRVVISDSETNPTYNCEISDVELL